MYSNKFNNKVVLITGHTGFKGSWLSVYLSQLGSKVIGLSDRVPTNPAHYDLIDNNLHDNIIIDIINPF